MAWAARPMAPTWVSTATATATTSSGRSPLPEASLSGYVPAPPPPARTRARRCDTMCFCQPGLADTHHGGCLDNRRVRVPVGDLEERQFVALDAAQGVVVESDAADAPIGGEHAGLRLDLLSREDAGNGCE